MTLIVLCISLLIERFFNFSHIRNWDWYGAYLRLLAQKFATLAPIALTTLALLPAALAIWLLDLVLKDTLYGFLSFVFHILLLLYCLGPKNLWADMVRAEGSIVPANQVKIAFNAAIEQPIGLSQSVLEAFFIACNSRVFAVILFYTLFGIKGAFLYRLLTLFVDSEAFAHSSGVTAVAVRYGQKCLSLADWLPIRILTLLFALSGNFMKVFSVWLHYVLDGVNSNYKLLTECGSKAMLEEADKSEAGEKITIKSALQLYDRALVISLVVIALMTISL